MSMHRIYDNFVYNSSSNFFSAHFARRLFYSPLLSGLYLKGGAVSGSVYNSSIFFLLAAFADY